MRHPLYRGPAPPWYRIARELVGWTVALAAIALAGAVWAAVLWVLMAAWPDHW